MPGHDHGLLVAACIAAAVCCVALGEWFELLPSLGHLTAGAQGPGGAAAAASGSQLEQRCQEILRVHGSRYLQVAFVDEQMLNGLHGLREVMNLARVTNRTFVEPLCGTARTLACGCGSMAAVRARMHTRAGTPATRTHVCRTWPSRRPTQALPLPSNSEVAFAPRVRLGRAACFERNRCFVAFDRAPCAARTVRALPCGTCTGSPDAKVRPALCRPRRECFW